MVRRAPPHCGHGSSSGTWSRFCLQSIPRFCLQSVQTICMRGQQHVFALERVDLAEDWFDDRLAPGVGALASFGAELAGHPLLGREVLRGPTCGCRLDEFVAFESARGDQEVGACLLYTSP